MFNAPTLRQLGLSLISGFYLGACAPAGDNTEQVIKGSQLAKTENATIDDNGVLYLASDNSVYRFADSDFAASQPQRVFHTETCQQVTGLNYARQSLYIACLDTHSGSIFEQRSSLYIWDTQSETHQRIALEESPMLANGLAVVGEQLYISNSYLNLDFSSPAKLSEIVRVSLAESDYGQQYSALKRSPKGNFPNGLQSLDDKLYYVDGDNFNRLYIDSNDNIEAVEIIAKLSGLGDDFSLDNNRAYIANFSPSNQGIDIVDLNSGALEKKIELNFLPSSSIWYERQLYATSLLSGGLYRIQFDNVKQ